MVAIEGIEGLNDMGGWGNGLSGLKERQSKLPLNKIIYAPHQYGLAIKDNNSTETGWDANYGFIKKTDSNALVMIGEWARGKKEGVDDGESFPEPFAKYIDARGYDSFYWATQHTSSDTYNFLGIAGTANSETKIVPTPEVLKYMNIAVPNPVVPPFPAQPQ
jgi:hypothetical protein